MKKGASKRTVTEEKLLEQKKVYQHHLRSLQKSLRNQMLSQQQQRTEAIAELGFHAAKILKRRKCLGADEDLSKAPIGPQFFPEHRPRPPNMNHRKDFLALAQSSFPTVFPSNPLAFPVHICHAPVDSWFRGTYCPDSTSIPKKKEGRLETSFDTRKKKSFTVESLLS